MTRDREVRANRAAPWLRAGTRVLMVTGFAGAAWLLSSAAAYAADAADTGLLRALRSDSTAVLSQTDPTVGGLLPSAVTGTGRAGDTIQVLTRTIEPILTSRAPADSTGPADDLVRSVTAVVSPPDVPGGVASTDLLHRVLAGGDHVIRPVAGLVSPVTSVARDAVTPISRVVHPVTRSVTADPDRARAATDPGVASGRAGKYGADGGMRSGPATVPAANFAPALTPGGAVPPNWADLPGGAVLLGQPVLAGQSVPPGGAVMAHAGPRAPVLGAPVPGAPVTGLTAGPADGRSAPDGTGSVPPYTPRTVIPGTPGAGTGGTSTSGSGSTQDGGGYAIAPITAAAGPADFRRDFRAAEVEVSRLVAQSPTFSPD